VLKDSGKFVGIVTANGKHNLEHDLIITQIPKDIFDYIQTEEDTIFHKPDGHVFRPVHEYIDELNIYPHEVLYVGDSMQDFKAAAD
jgi:HAD superfamily hydrolase (TIGR01549 family)